MWEDPIVADVRRVRDELCAKFNYDVKAIFEDMRQRQATVGDRLVRRVSVTEPEKADVANGEPRDS
ncbi:MAG: hypothetical protein GXP27_04190 [Planctomycetes bacterium]|nr:hypothetical protein [Planctomycetota bacterium]